ncbi:hypothetical protein CK625_03565 [Vandammella animalimorsus]|uniref:Uncharacterized protein n=1 Tax=Vandammella animalimorsus TaxID=2029117 RepID=A0A2A2AJ06_9BURK|nr:hypothetical protein CK625_03565 [Vandammella animalimorsus]
MRHLPASPAAGQAAGLRQRWRHWLGCALLALGMAGCAVHDSAYYGDGHYGHVRGHSLGGYAYPPRAYSWPPGAVYRGRYYGQPAYLVPYPGPDDYYWPGYRRPYYAPPPGYGPPYGHPHGHRPAPRVPSWLNRKPPPSVPAPPPSGAQQALDRPFQPPDQGRNPHWLQPQPPQPHTERPSPASGSVLRPLPQH